MFVYLYITEKYSACEYNSLSLLLLLFSSSFFFFSSLLSSFVKKKKKKKIHSVNQKEFTARQPLITLLGNSKYLSKREFICHINLSFLRILRHKLASRITHSYMQKSMYPKNEKKKKENGKKVSEGFYPKKKKKNTTLVHRQPEK